MNNKLKEILKTILVFLLYFNLIYVVIIVFKFIPLNKETLPYIDLISSIFLIIMLIYLYKNTLKEDIKEFKSKLLTNINKVIQLTIILLLFKLLSGYLSSALSLAFKIDLPVAENQDLINNYLKNIPIVTIISSVLFAPINEELVYRLSIRKIINNDKIFILISGVLFGLVHIFPTKLNILVASIQSVPYVVAGLVLAYQYTKEKNIITIMSVHMLNNLLGILAALM